MLIINLFKQGNVVTQSKAKQHVQHVVAKGNDNALYMLCLRLACTPNLKAITFEKKKRHKGNVHKCTESGKKVKIIITAKQNMSLWNMDKVAETVKGKKTLQVARASGK